MEKIVNIKNYFIKLTYIDKVLYIDSLQISKIFNRKHEQIVEFVNELPIDDFTNKNIKYKNNHTLLTRDGFMILVSRINDKHSYKNKVATLEAFDLMLDYISKNNL
ncbi:Rha family transcriptional regulator [Campylobacter sp. RM16188]|uniref:Rha family transcriptional regulator n=1 Tax=Campylobacter sp. RM16188 TaxID=1705725 RepID=UPI0015535232|nr:Rha family transcriptional regulator [Campylobacter sp. RM16188]